MSIAIAVAASLLAAFALAAVVFSFSYTAGRFTTLWQGVSTEERARFGLLVPSHWHWPLRLFVAFWVLRHTAGELLTHWGMFPPLAAFLRSPLAASLALLFYALLFAFPILWSWRVLRQPVGACSAALRRLAIWTFSLSVGALVLAMLLAFWAARL